MVAQSLVASTRRGHRGLFVFAVAMAILAIALVVATAVDRRTLLGAPLWFKPLKFAVSFALYAGALAWLLGRLQRVSRAVRVTGWVIVCASTVEMVIIVGQAARGQRSHFNDDSSLGIVLYAVMGVTIAVLYLAAIGIAVAVLRQAGPDRVVTLAVRAGLLVTLLGFGVGVVMVLHGAHAVGVPDGGPGLPLAGWSTTGGDLRIGHFVGIHGLQILPLAAAAVVAVGRDRWAEATSLRIVIVTAASYTALVVLLTWQALRGQPLTAPDAFTVLALGLIAVGTAAAVAHALRADAPVPAA